MPGSAGSLLGAGCGTVPRMAGLGLTARALWWRRGASATLLAVATVTTAAAALGPVYARAAGESTLRDALTLAPSQVTGLQFAQQRDVSLKQAVGDFDATLPALGSVKEYPKRINEIDTAAGSLEVEGTSGRVLAKVAWRDGACGQVDFVSGRCPRAPGEAMVSARTLTGGYGAKLGSVLDLNSLQVNQLGQDGAAVQVSTKVKVVGVYKVRNPTDPFWFGRAYFNAHLFDGPGDGPDTVDTVFVDRTLFPTLTRPSIVNVLADYPLDPTSVRLADEAPFVSVVDQLLNKYGAGSGFALDTSVLATLQTADTERDELDVSTILVTVQLALLAWLVLFQVMADAAESRGTEIALAKLRGLGAFGTVRFGLGEPVLLLVIAIPLGLIGAWTSISVMAKVVLVPGTPVVLPLGAVAGSLIGFAGGAVAAALAARRTLTRPVLEQWRRVPQDASAGAATLLLDLVVVAAAIAGLVALRSHGGGSAEPRPASLLGPGLLVLAVGLLGVRLLPFFGRAAFVPTRASRHVGLFLAVRQVVRRPAGLRLAALLAVAIGLATFAIDGEAVASGNRTNRASIEVGAAQVVLTQFSISHDPMSIARKVDPDGTWAMAAALWLPNGGPVAGNILAVDSPRLAAVSLWPASSKASRGHLAELDASAVAAAIGPPVPKPIVVTTTSMRLRVTLVSKGPGPAPDLQLEVQAPGHRVTAAKMGTLQPGTHDYTATVPCAGGCTVERIVIDRPIDFFATMRGTLVVASMQQLTGATYADVDARLSTPGEWRGQGSPASSDKPTVTAAGLQDVYSSTGGASSALGHKNSPLPVPLVATPASIVRDPTMGPSVMVDITATAMPYQEVATIPLLPSALDNGVIVDLGFIRSQLPDFDNEAHWQVWLGATAPPDAIQRLRAAGLTIGIVSTEKERSAQLGRQGTALALLLLVACAIAGAVLAAGATALAVAVTGRRRSFELAALRAVGVSRRVLLRSCILEQLILLGTGFVLGLPTGIVAARIALPEIPEFSDTTPIPLDFSAHVLAIALFGATVFALLVVTAFLAGRALMRAAVPTRLREAAP